MLFIFDKHAKSQIHSVFLCLKYRQKKISVKPVYYLLELNLRSEITEVDEPFKEVLFLQCDIYGCHSSTCLNTLPRHDLSEWQSLPFRSFSDGSPVDFFQQEHTWSNSGEPGWLLRQAYDPGNVSGVCSLPSLWYKVSVLHPRQTLPHYPSALVPNWGDWRDLRELRNVGTERSTV